jgi:hypothetical protein
MGVKAEWTRRAGVMMWDPTDDFTSSHVHLTGRKGRLSRCARRRPLYPIVRWPPLTGVQGSRSWPPPFRSW